MSRHHATSRVRPRRARFQESTLAASLAAFLAAPCVAAAFEVEPAAPTRCDEIDLLVTRSFTSDCGWSATSDVVRGASTVDVSLVLHQAGDICLPVARDKTFRIPIGSLDPGDWTIRVAWSDLDQRPEEEVVQVADPPSCPPRLRRGDSNSDGEVDIADPVHLLVHLFAGGPAPACAPLGDADADGSLGIADAVWVLAWLFRSGPAPQRLSADEQAACSPPEPFSIASSAFPDGEAIPTKHTCEGSNVSPPLAWSGAPAGTRSFALTCLDPDAPSGTFVHWLAWDMPPASAALAEGEKPAVEGTNGAGRVGYTGPCPPVGHGVHHYMFTLYALDVDTLSLPPSTRRTGLEAALEGHILGTAVVTGTYRRD